MTTKTNTDTILTQREAVKRLAEFSGQRLDEEDITSAEADIGDPDVTLPITETSETVDDFRKSGWSDHCRGEFNESGLVVLAKGSVTATIADIGDSRLVWIDR